MLNENDRLFKKKKYEQCILLCRRYLPWKGACPFIFTKLNPLHPRIFVSLECCTSHVCGINISVKECYSNTNLFVCLFGVFAPLEICRRHHYRWRASNFDLYSALWPLSSEGFKHATSTVIRDILSIRTSTKSYLIIRH